MIVIFILIGELDVIVFYIVFIVIGSIVFVIMNMVRFWYIGLYGNVGGLGLM